MGIAGSVTSVLAIANDTGRKSFHFDVSRDWQVLGGPEKEEGDPVKILDNSNGDLTLLVKRRRGTVIRGFSPTRVPAEIHFRFQSTFDPDASEVPTELFGTGDFRIFVGTKGTEFGDNDGPATRLTSFEGFQFRVFPHLKDSPSRRKTGEESHTATSIWIRYIDRKRCTGSHGEPHTGLMSDACQRRNRQNGIHNCGWSRVLLGSGGFGLNNGESSEVSIRISRELVSIECGGKRFSYHIKKNELRIDKVDTIAIAHTNISRGYKTLKISDLKVVPMPATESDRK